MSNFGWSLPPGVTGNEPAIAGYPPCRNCGHEIEDHLNERPDANCCDGDCEGHTECLKGCPCGEYREEFDPWLDGPDPDRKHDSRYD